MKPAWYGKSPKAGAFLFIICMDLIFFENDLKVTLRHLV